MAETVVELVVKAKNETEQAFRRVDGAIKDLAKDIQVLGKANFNKLEAESKQAESRVNSIGVASAKARQALRNLDKSRIRNIREDADRASQSFLNMGRAITGVLASLGAGFGIATIIQDVNEFSTAVAEVSTLVDSSARSNAQLRQDVLGVAEAFGAGATETASALYDIISAGASAGAEANTQLEAALTLATAGITDAKTAADLLTTVMNAFNLSAEQATDVNDILFTTVKQGKTTIDELASSFSTIAPIAAQAGIGLDEIGAAVATLTAQGQTTSEAMTGLRGAIVGLTKTKDAQEAVQALGFESFSAAVRAKGLQGALQLVIDSAEGSEAQLLKLFGRVEGLNAALGVTGRQADRFSNNLEAFASRAGATQTALEKVRAEVGFKFQEEINRLKRTFLELEPIIKDIATDILPALGAAAKSVVTFLRENQEAVGILIKSLGVLIGLSVAKSFIGWIIPLKTITGLLQTSVTHLATFGSSMVKTQGLLTATGGFVRGLTSNLGLMAAAAVAVGLGFKSWLEHLTEAEDKLQRSKERLDQLNLTAQIGAQKLQELGNVDLLTPEQVGTLILQDANEELTQYIARLEAVRTATIQSVANLERGAVFDQAQESISDLTVAIATAQDALNAVTSSTQEAATSLEAQAKAVQGVFIAAAGETATVIDMLQTLGPAATATGKTIADGFDTAKKAGEDLELAAFKIIESLGDLDEINLEGLEAAFQNVSGIGEEAAQALFDEFASRLEDLSDEELAAFLEASKKTFGEVADSAKVHAGIVEEAFSRALDDLGIDFGKATLNIRDEILELESKFKTLGKQFATSGVEVKEQAKLIADALGNLRIETQEEFLELQRQLEAAFGSDVLKLKPVQDALLQLNPKVSEAEKAAAKAAAATRDWNSALVELKPNLDGAGTEAEQLARAANEAAKAEQQAAGGGAPKPKQESKPKPDSQPPSPRQQKESSRSNERELSEREKIKQKNQEISQELDNQVQLSEAQSRASASTKNALFEAFDVLNDLAKSGGGAAEAVKSFFQLGRVFKGQNLSEALGKIADLTQEIQGANTRATNAFADAEAGIITMGQAISQARVETRLLNRENLGRINNAARQLREEFEAASRAAKATELDTAVNLAQAQGDDEAVLRAESAARIQDLKNQQKDAGAAGVNALRQAIENEERLLQIQLENLRKAERENERLSRLGHENKLDDIETETKARVGALFTVADAEVAAAQSAMERIQALRDGTGGPSGQSGLPQSGFPRRTSTGFSPFGFEGQPAAGTTNFNFTVDGSDLLSEENIRRRIVPVLQRIQSRSSR